MMRRILTYTAALLLAVAALAPAGAIAQSEVGSVVSAVGAVDVQRGGRGEWQTAMVGTPLFVSDEVRTGPGAASKLLFQDDSVVDLAADTQISVARYATGGQAEARSLLRLVSGKLRALIGESTGGDRTRYEIETPTAVARAQGAVFIVRYAAADKLTDVVAIENDVEVQGKIGVIGPGVKVGPGELTQVHAGRFPSPPERVPEGQMAEYASGLEIIGTGSRDSLDVGSPVVEAHPLRPEDRPQVARGGAAGAPEVSYLHPAVPGETLIDQLSPDVRANTQPILEYKKFPASEPVPPQDRPGK